MSYAEYFKKKKKKKKVEVKCKLIIQKVLFSIFHIIFIQSMNIKNNEPFLLERSVFFMVCSYLFFEISCTDHLGKKRSALSKSKISLNSINNCIWSVGILLPLDKFHLKEYCQQNKYPKRFCNKI